MDDRSVLEEGAVLLPSAALPAAPISAVRYDENTRIGSEGRVDPQIRFRSEVPSSRNDWPGRAEPRRDVDVSNHLVPPVGDERVYASLGAVSPAERDEGQFILFARITNARYEETMRTGGVVRAGPRRIAAVL